MHSESKLVLGNYLPEGSLCRQCSHLTGYQILHRVPIIGCSERSDFTDTMENNIIQYCTKALVPVKPYSKEGGK